MIKLIIKKTIKDYDNIEDIEVRNKYNNLGGILGIICNTLLFTLKMVCGWFINSIAIISDAFNNLSDMGSSLITIVGTKISNIKPDERHPFGHGRFEYIASFIISFIILFFGLQIFIQCINKIMNPSVVEFNWTIFIILCCSILVKIWMYSYNNYMGKKINSSLLIATSKDSFSDIIASIVVLNSLLVSNYVSFPIDAIMGIFVSLLILKTGIELMTHTISLLLGQRPSKELVKKIEDIILSKKEILGVHDLLIHDYGPGRTFASAHAEILDTSNIVEAHEIIDEIEKEVLNKLNILITIHMDPITVDNPILNNAKEQILNYIKNIDGVSAHDFRIINGEKRINIIFDLVVPYEETDNEKTILLNNIEELLKQVDNRIKLDCNVEHSFGE